jgi:hypothetical protein
MELSRETFSLILHNILALHWFRGEIFLKRFSYATYDLKCLQDSQDSLWCKNPAAALTVTAKLPLQSHI